MPPKMKKYKLRNPKGKGRAPAPKKAKISIPKLPPPTTEERLAYLEQLVGKLATETTRAPLSLSEFLKLRQKGEHIHHWTVGQLKEFVAFNWMNWDDEPFPDFDTWTIKQFKNFMKEENGEFPFTWDRSWMTTDLREIDRLGYDLEERKNENLRELRNKGK